MLDEIEAPVTLGDKLKIQSGGQPASFSQFLLSAIIGLLFWWIFESLPFGIGAALLCLLYFVALSFKRNRANHFLIYADQQNFMKTLKLADKTVIFDGSNIYHFGLENGVGRKALGILIQTLRSDGFRVICFFDANIYFTLRKNGAFQDTSKRFSIAILQDAFGLRETEIYVVPRGIQADRFIVESLSHLPVSFAVTNDRFRDYEAEYDFMVKDKQWRKGITIKEGTLLLYQYNFKQPLLM